MTTTSTTVALSDASSTVIETGAGVGTLAAAGAGAAGTGAVVSAGIDATGTAGAATATSPPVIR